MGAPQRKREVTLDMVMAVMRRNVGITCTDLSRLLSAKTFMLRPVLDRMVHEGFLVMQRKDKDTVLFVIAEVGEWPTRPGASWNTGRDLSETDYCKKMAMHRKLCEEMKRR